MEHACEVLTWAARPTATIRTRTPVQDLPAIIGQSYAQIMPHIGAAGAQPVEPPMVVYHNRDMQDLDLEIGFVVSQAVPDKDDIQASQLPAGKAAACIHQGPYDGLAATYARLEKWALAEGHTPTGIAYEFYISDPGDTPPDQLLTRIVFPLKS